MNKIINAIKLNKILEEINNYGHRDINIENYFDGQSENEIMEYLQNGEIIKSDLIEYINNNLAYDREIKNIKYLINNLF